MERSSRSVMGALCAYFLNKKGWYIVDDYSESRSQTIMRQS